MIGISIVSEPSGVTPGTSIRNILVRVVSARLRAHGVEGQGESLAPEAVIDPALIALAAHLAVDIFRFYDAPLICPL